MTTRPLFCRLAAAMAWVTLCLAKCSCDTDLTGDSVGDEDVDHAEPFEGPDDETTRPCENCDDGDPCTVDSCDTLTGECLHSLIDGDVDGSGAMLAPDGETPCPGDDCDDTDASVYPGAPEVCVDGIDQDCDGLVDGPIGHAGSSPFKALTDLGADPQVIWTGSEFIIGWDETSIFLARVDTNGRIIGETLQLSTGSGFHGDLSISWSGSEVGFAYAMNYEQVFFALVDPLLGEMGDPVLLSDPSALALAPGVTWNGTEFGILWMDGRDAGCAELSGCETELYFSRVGPDGVRIGTESRLTDVDGVAWRTSARPLWTGSGYGFAWGNWALDFSWSRYFFSRIGADGSRMGDDVAMPGFVSGMAWSGSEFGAAWSETASAYRNLTFARLNPQGEMAGEAVMFRHDTHAVGGPGLAWIENGFGMAWSDGRDWGCTENSAVIGDCSTDLYVSFTDPLGNIRWNDVRLTSRNTEILAFAPGLAWTGDQLGIAWMEGTDPSHVYVYFEVVSFCD
jgi:hypothetical protein